MFNHFLLVSSSKTSQNNIKLKGLSEDKAFIIAGTLGKPKHESLLALRGSNLGRACVTVHGSFFMGPHVMQHLFICAEGLEIFLAILSLTAGPSLIWTPRCCLAAYLDASNRCQISQITHIFTQMKSL